MAVVTQFFIPAEIPVIPLVVPKDLLLPANALFGMGVYGSVLIGYALAGPFFTFFGPQGVFVVLALLILIAAVFISFVQLKRVDMREKNAETASIAAPLKDELKTVFSLITRTKRVYQSIFLLTLSQVIILTLSVVGPGYAGEVLQIDIGQFPLLFATPAAFGMVTGGIITAYFFHNHPRQRVVIIGLVLSAVAILLLPYGSKVTSRAIVGTINAFLPHAFSITIEHIMVALAFLLGLGNAFVFVPANTVLQEETSDQLRGKVYGMLNAIVGVFSFFPILLVGELADSFGVGSVLSWIGIFLLGIVVIQFFSKVPKKQN
jgi:MFS family permease